MSKPLSSTTHMPRTISHARICANCGGTGCLVIKNAYDLQYERVEQCDKCGGTGFMQLPSDKPLPN